MKPVDDAPQRIRDAASVLPILGAFLLLPPVVTLFAVQVDVAGVPLLVVYLFGVWLALIVCAALLARRLSTDDTHHPVAGGGGDRPD